jgi:transposase
MTQGTERRVLSDAQWVVLSRLIEACRPVCKTEHIDLRRTIEAIIWRHENGAKWRQIPAELGRWWRAAQTFNRWSHLGVWQRLLERAQDQGGVPMGMAFLDGTSIRAQHKAAGARKGGARGRRASSAKRSAARVGATAPRPV